MECLRKSVLYLLCAFCELRVDDGFGVAFVFRFMTPNWAGLDSHKHSHCLLGFLSQTDLGEPPAFVCPLAASEAPSTAPSAEPTNGPTHSPSDSPSEGPSAAPSPRRGLPDAPSSMPTTDSPTFEPTDEPTDAPFVRCPPVPEPPSKGKGTITVVGVMAGVSNFLFF